MEMNGKINPSEQLAELLTMNTTQFIQHLANGKTIESDKPIENIYDDGMRNRMFERAMRSISTGNFEVRLDEGAELREQAVNYINDATDMEYYREFFGDAEMNTKQLIYTLATCWLRANYPRDTKGGMGGGWSCGGLSGLWADFSLKIKVKKDFGKKHYCPFNAYFIGVRVCLNNDRSIERILNIFGRGLRERFDITQFDFSYEPYKTDKTTVLFPNFGGNWSPKKMEDMEKAEAELLEMVILHERNERRKQKELAHQAFLAEQREREREWRARLEADLAATIVAYNAEEENLKKVIRFNREKVAEPLAKRIEAKEAERQREEAERRHAEKMRQKEAERLAKFAPKRK